MTINDIIFMTLGASIMFYHEDVKKTFLSIVAIGVLGLIFG